MKHPSGEPSQGNQPTHVRKRPKGRTVILVLLGLALVAELVLRLGLGLGNPLLYQPDADCTYLPKANQDIKRFGCHIKTNAHGMRSDDFPTDKSPGVRRILFIGDSVTFGTTYVDQEDIFTSRLQRALAKRLGNHVEVLNASAGGWRVGNEVGFLKSRGTFNADEVIFVLNPQDVVQSPGRVDFSLAGGFPQNKPPCALWELWDRYVLPRLLRHRPRGDAVVEVESSPDVATATPVILNQLTEAREFALRSHAAFSLILIPISETPQQMADYAPGVKMLREWAAEHHVPFLDITAALAPWPSERIYFHNSHPSHPTAKGHEIIAAEIERLRLAFPTTLPAAPAR